MVCYECELSGIRRDAVALCHHCSAALCSEHAAALSDPITERYPYSGSSFCRSKLCMTCKQALEQTTKWNAAKNHIGQFVSESDAVHVGSR